MVLTASAERAALADSAARLVRDRYANGAVHLAAGGAFDVMRWREFADLGWLVTAIDEDNGGLDLGFGVLSVLSEALAPAAMPEPLISQLARVGFVLNAAEPSALRDAVLGKWAGGEELSALAHHESRSASYYAAPISATARVDGDGFVLNGTKSAVIDGGIANWLLVSLRAADGVGLFAVAADSPGVDVNAHVSFDGRSVADVEFVDVRVPGSARLTFATATAAIIDRSLGLYTLLNASESLGIVKSLLDVCHEHLRTREQFGVKLVDFQVLQHRLVDMHLAIIRLESLIELARFKVDEQGIDAAARFIAAAAVKAASVSRHVGHQAVQLHGAIGMTDELIVGHYLKRLTANELSSGGPQQHLTRYTEHPDFTARQASGSSREA